jgi:FkbM family methyltransferase
MNDPGLTPWMTRRDLASRQVSYAQNFEDILLARAFPGPSGFYIDVGANHPVFHSVTKRFYDLGWRGINVEPNPRLFRALAAQRPRDVNLNAGLSDADGALTFYEVLDHRHGWSTFHPDAAAAYRRQGVQVAERPVPVTTLASICDRHAPPDAAIDFLKIDAEAFELQVLRGNDWSRWRPRVVLVEGALPGPVAEWEPVLLGNGYRFAAFDGINRYYLRGEDHALAPAFAAPVNALDNAVSHEILRLVRPPGGPARAALDHARAYVRRRPALASLARRLLRRPNPAGESRVG